MGLGGINRNFVQRIVRLYEATMGGMKSFPINGFGYPRAFATYPVGIASS
jgi:hypothetical protein